MFGWILRPNPIKSCCNGMTAQVGSIGPSGERITLASKSKISECRELKASATSVDCPPPEAGIGSKFRRVTWDFGARQLAAWRLVFSGKNQTSYGIGPGIPLEHQGLPCRCHRALGCVEARLTPA